MPRTIPRRLDPTARPRQRVKAGPMACRGREGVNALAVLVICSALVATLVEAAYHVEEANRTSSLTGMELSVRRLPGSNQTSLTAVLQAKMRSPHRVADRNAELLVGAIPCLSISKGHAEVNACTLSMTMSDTACLPRCALQRSGIHSYHEIGTKWYARCNNPC